MKKVKTLVGVLLAVIFTGAVAEARTVFQWKCEPVAHSKAIGGCQALAVTFKADEFPDRKGCKGQGKRSHNWTLYNTFAEEDDPSEIAAVQTELDEEKQKNRLLGDQLNALRKELQEEREKNAALEKRLEALEKKRK